MRRLLLLAIAAVALPVDAWAQTAWPSGYVTKDAIERAHAQKRDGLYTCYTRHVSAESRKHGDIVRIRVTASQSGAVFRVDFLESSYTSEKFEACVRDLLTTIDYGVKATEKTVFVQTIGFQNGEDKLTFSAPEPAGGAITSDTVVAMAKSRSADVQKCYTDALSSNPSLRGQLVVEVVIDGATGRPQSTRVVKKTLYSPAVEECVLRVVNSFSFPLPADPGLVIVQLPLTFEVN